MALVFARLLAWSEASCEEVFRRSCVCMAPILSDSLLYRNENDWLANVPDTESFEGVAKSFMPSASLDEELLISFDVEL